MRTPGKDGEAVTRRQEAVTWGLLALSVFVSLGMAEWSKRSAVGEAVAAPVPEKEVHIVTSDPGTDGVFVVKKKPDRL